MGWDKLVVCSCWLAAQKVNVDTCRMGVLSWAGTFWGLTCRHGESLLCFAYMYDGERLFTILNPKIKWLHTIANRGTNTGLVEEYELCHFVIHHYDVQILAHTNHFVDPNIHECDWTCMIGLTTYNPTVTYICFVTSNSSLKYPKIIVRHSSPRSCILVMEHK